LLLLIAGLLAIAFGAELARRGYVATRRKPYYSANGRLALGAVIVGVGLAVVIMAAVMMVVG
jgi:hypothetical protein